jgi:hypothetical protein
MSLTRAWTSQPGSQGPRLPLKRASQSSALLQPRRHSSLNQVSVAAIKPTSTACIPFARDFAAKLVTLQEHRHGAGCIYGPCMSSGEALRGSFQAHVGHSPSHSLMETCDQVVCELVPSHCPIDWKSNVVHGRPRVKQMSRGHETDSHIASGCPFAIKFVDPF